jgi:hypothetical protein
MVVVISCLYFLVALKLLAMINAIRWMLSYGSEYRSRISKAPATTAGERDQILDACHAGFFPFGLKDYRLSSYIRDSDSGGLKRSVVGFFRKYLFQFPGPAFGGALILIATAKLPASVTLTGSHTYGWVGAGYGILMMAVVITFSVEAFISYAVLGSYGTAFHRLNVPREKSKAGTREPPAVRTGRTEPIVTEMTAYGGILITGYVIMSSTIYFVSMRLGGFDYIPGWHGPTLVEPVSLFDSLYWTAVVPVDFNGAGPIGALPRVIVLLGFIAIFVMVTFVVFILGIAMASMRKPPHTGARHVEKAATPTSLSSRGGDPDTGHTLHDVPGAAQRTDGDPQEESNDEQRTQENKTDEAHGPASEHDPRLGLQSCESPIRDHSGDVVVSLRDGGCQQCWPAGRFRWTAWPAGEPVRDVSRRDIGSFPGLRRVTRPGSHPSTARYER